MFLSQSIRQYGREIVRSFGFLSPTHPSGLSFSKVHALIELGAHGPCNAKQLGEALCLEKSSTSRLVQYLLKEGWITVSLNTEDVRSKRLALSERGEEKLAEINHHADQHIFRVLDFLTPEQQEQVVVGLQNYARALEHERRSKNIQFSLIQPEDNKPLERVCREVLSEFNADKEGFAYADPELSAMFSVFNQAGWCYYVCKQEQMFLGGAGIGPLQGADSQYCELKKMYLSKQSRGLGLGKCLLSKLIAKARELNYRYMYLETLESMSDANRLYQQFGFEKLKGPMGNTGHYGCDAWYVLML